MQPMPLRWKVKPILDAHNVTPYRLMKDTNLSREVVYGIVNNTHEALDARVIDKLVPYLRELTRDKSLQIGDVVEYQ